jgi:hypothetical protein
VFIYLPSSSSPSLAEKIGTPLIKGRKFVFIGRMADDQGSSKPWRSNTSKFDEGSLNAVPDKGCPNLLSERDVDGDDGDEDNSSVAENSPGNPCCQRNNSQPFGYSQHHTLAHVATNHEAVMQYTNSQWNSRLHSDFQ